MQEEKIETAVAPTESKIDANLVATATKELEDHKKSLKGKVYPIKVKDENSIYGYITFIEQEAEWKSTEALGIIEVSKILNEVKNEKLKDNSFFLPNLAIEALSFFLNKVGGNGKEKAVSFIELFKPVNQAMGMIKSDTEKLFDLERRVAAAEHGLTVEEKIEKKDE